MDYYISIFIRNLKKENFFEIINTLDKFASPVFQAEKDLIIARSQDIKIISCLLKLSENFPEIRIGFSRYLGLAKGLSKIAQFKEILISEEIEKDIIEDYEITSLGMLSIEGMSSQILVCKIDAPAGEIKFPAIQKPEHRIARKNEIELFKNLLRVANAVLVIGPPASGKTIFLKQLTEQWPEKEIYQTFCPAYSIGRTLKPIKDIVSQLLKINTIDGIEQKQRTIEKKLKELDIMDIGTSYLALLDFLDLNEEDSILEKIELTTRVDIISNSIAEIIKCISWNKEVVIIIEDIEYMDASSVHFTQQLIQKLVEEKVCFIFSSSTAQVNLTGLKEFELKNIDKKILEQLIAEQTEEKINLPPTTPLHVSQYLLLFKEEKENYIYNQYKGEAALAPFNLPFHDLQTIIKRRIDLLNNDARELIFSLAVAGFELNPDELPIDRKNLPSFDFFVEQKFIKRYLNRFTFISSIFHNEIYNLVDDKKARHERLADYYRRIQGFEEPAAFHYLKAENYKKAIEFLMKAANTAVHKGGYESGIDFYNQALDICHRQKDAADLEVLVALNESLADVYRALGDEEKALKYYKVVLDSYKEILKE